MDGSSSAFARTARRSCSTGRSRTAISPAPRRRAATGPATSIGISRGISGIRDPGASCAEAQLALDLLAQLFGFLALQGPLPAEFVAIPLRLAVRDDRR